MPEEFRRSLNAYFKKEYLVVDRKLGTITTKRYKEDIYSAMFLQALQIKAPESMKKLIRNDFVIKSKSKSYNSRSTCCFENVLVSKIDDLNLEIGFLPHPNCDTTEYEKHLVRNKIIKWYINFFFI